MYIYMCAIFCHKYRHILPVCTQLFTSIWAFAIVQLICKIEQIVGDNIFFFRQAVALDCNYKGIWHSPMVPMCCCCCFVNYVNYVAFCYLCRYQLTYTKASFCTSCNTLKLQWECMSSFRWFRDYHRWIMKQNAIYFKTLSQMPFASLSLIFLE